MLPLLFISSSEPEVLCPEVVVLPDLLFDLVPDVVPISLEDPLPSVFFDPFVALFLWVEPVSTVVVEVVEFIAISLLFADVLVKARRAIEDAMHATKK